ncbi:SDR family NAD(P)-dependent oxidoreductase [Streptosporangium sp. NBC_01756]|uniref:SDR family NAD(P)-dependent oxidoreductase n=1 Tax=Streptosporangium sp. NBC_01756 TaxID=2975950 RepID=UPI002DD8F0EB|nr:SDR family NAD(P)-dependent oxidoreductase [Streptosporangium sp. NBC_01756]WSC85706.1 SDR family oxidoreductase [Streptosporangium sp. NBC_01756]
MPHENRTSINGPRLEGKRAVVTGAGSGIGRACAERLAAEGARVACLDRDADALRALTDALPESTVAVCCDVSDEQAVSTAFETARKELGAIDVGVLCAGIYLANDDAPVHELSLDAWQRTLNVNLTGMFLTARETVRMMLNGEGGSIVMIGSPTGIYGMELGMHAYSASKGGVHALARVMANEYAARGIRVNVVVPGFIHTGLNDWLFADSAAVDGIVSNIPLRRPGEPAEIAGLVAWLSSSDASYSTGAIFTADGGLTAV